MLSHICCPIFDEYTIILIERGQPKTNQQVFLKARDMEAIRQYLLQIDV